MLVDQLRQIVIQGLDHQPNAKKQKKTAGYWPIWRKVITEGVHDWSDPEEVLRIGDRLAEVFAETKLAGARTQSEEQSETSGGGAAWEALVCWYLNLCLIGTQAVVVKRQALLAGVLRNAIAVNYGTKSVNSESDLMAVTFPSEAPFTGADAGSEKKCTETIDQGLRAGGLSRTCLTVIQCKTNWNDNAQVPMLWNLVYQSLGFEQSQVTVGKENVSPRSLKRFRYAFVTVPTVRLEKIKPDGLSVIRLADLTGKNYWGYPTKDKTALSLREIFTNASIGPDMGHGVKESLRTGLKDLRTRYVYFGV